MALSAHTGLSAPCNPLANPTFESGTLYPWIPSAEDVAQVVGDADAYNGDYYL